MQKCANSHGVGMHILQRGAWKKELTYVLEKEGTCMGTTLSALNTLTQSGMGDGLGCA